MTSVFPLRERARSLAKRVSFRVTRDALTGHLYYEVDGVRVYLRSPLECVRPHHRDYAFEEIYFRHYLPKRGDTVVDFGAGLGTEIVLLAAVSPHVRYIAVEIQPWVYECLCLTLAQLPRTFVPYGLAVGDGSTARMAPTAAGIDASVHGGAVLVEGVTWSQFIARHGIECVDLLKMNIEGAEAFLLSRIELSKVKRVIVSCHDFRADRGEGEHFRTRNAVEGILTDAGFRITPIDGPEDWMRSWLYAERST